MIENATIFSGVVPPPERIPLVVILLCAGFGIDWFFVKILLHFVEK